MIDKTSQFFAILTAVGEAKHANAIALGLDWMFTEMGLGDANGTDPIPDRLQTQLINEWRRAPINQIRVDPANPNTVITEQIIPPEVGGEWIREMGLYDVDGDLVAVANCAPSYKPLLAQGTGKTQVVRMNFIVSSSANIVLKIDPAVVLATREYVDLAISEALAKLDHKQSARVAATAAITLNNVQTIDDVAVVVGDRVLVTAQTQAQDNGLYVVSAEGWTRAADADNSLEVTPGLFIHVEQGTTNGDSLWQLVTDAPITLGTTGLQFEMIAGGNGSGVGTFRSVTVDALGRVIAGTNPTTLDGYGITDALDKAENLADLTDVVEARDNLGLGSAATHDAQSSPTDTTPQRLMEVGAFGLGVQGPMVGDLDALQGTQFFGFTDAAVGAVPGTGYDAVGWQVETSGQRTQFAVLNSALFIRTDDGSDVWGEWLQQWDSKTLVKQANSTDTTAGRVLLTGAFGVGARAPELPAKDFNAAQVGGTYTYAADFLNRPDFPNGSTHGFVTHMERSFGNLAYQEVHAKDNAMCYRYRIEDFATGTWTEWHHNWDTSNLVKQTSPQDDTPGRVLLAGAYGWGQGGIVLPEGTDLNTITAAGIYRVNSGLNIPAGGEFSPMLVAVSQDTLWQQIIGYSSGTTYTRGGVQTLDGFVFSAWVTSWDTSNFDPAAYQAALGFTPVQQGGGAGQDPNKIYIGYENASGEIKIQVDAQDFGRLWTESNFDPAAYQPSLGFTPVQQGTGAGQLTNVIKLGWTALNAINVTVDASDMGAMWTDAIGAEKVRGAIAGFGAGEVGTYGLFVVVGGGGVAMGPGTILAGGSLGWANTAGMNYGAPAGTWVLQGASANSGDGASYSTTVCKRIA